jgi:hypothetical protein
VERGVFPRPEIEERLRKFVKVRLWTNDPAPAARSGEWREMLEKRFGTSGIPLYVGLSPDGKELFRTGFAGGTPESFAGILAGLMDDALAKSAK